MIKPIQIAVIVSGVILTLGLYFYANLKGPAKVSPLAATGGHTNGEASAPDFNFAAYKDSVLKKLPADQSSMMKDFENQVAKASDKEVKKQVLNQLIAACEKNKLDAIACFYSKEIAEAENTATDWIKTGDDFSETYGEDSVADDLRAFLIQNATESYQKALELKPEDTETKIKLAGTYLDGQKQPMAGVSILLDIVKKDSNNIQAQFILGRYGIVSGQFDKAVQRLTRVTQLDPKNANAWFFLAQAYEGLGKKDKAIECFEKCKSLANDPQVSAEIDNYIERIKHS